MTTSELACVYSALILHDDEVPVTADKINALCKAAKVEVEPIWPSLFAKCLGDKDIGSLISAIGSAPAAGAAAPAAGGAEPAAVEEEKEPEPESEEESDDDMGFSLFD
jgi:large subunit ribosomal protein LP1